MGECPQENFSGYEIEKIASENISGHKSHTFGRTESYWEKDWEGTLFAAILKGLACHIQMLAVGLAWVSCEQLR